MARKPKLSDSAIVQILGYGIGQSVGFQESKLAKERERVQEFYDGERPYKQTSGDSDYNSRDVYDGVEMMHAQLLDTFAANKRPVIFDMGKDETFEASKLRTDYVTDVVFNQNPGYRIFSDTIRSGLLARNAIVKVWWDPVTTDEYVYLSKPAEGEVAAYLQSHADEDPQIKEMDLDEDGTTIRRVQIRLRKRDKSQVRVRLLPPEEFGISPMAEDLETADLVFHRQEMTVSELIQHGYDKEVVDTLQSDDRLWMAMEPEKIARFMPTDDLIGTRVNEDGQNATRTIMVYECYMRLDMEDDDIAQLYKVTYAGTEVLEKEPVESQPFVVFTPLPRPKAFWGTNYSELLIPTQKARTFLTRGIIRHTLTTNNPRMMVVKNAVANPKELTDNRFGGVVNVSRPDGIIPLPQASMNPFVFQTIQLLQSDKEERTGISNLSQGLDKDAVSKQNSQDMIHELITVSQMRQKVVARNFAELFLRDLYLKIYRLVLENEDRQKIVRVAGSWAPVNFQDWPEETSVSVSFNLGYGEQEKEAMRLAQIGQALRSEPALAPWVTPTQVHNLAYDAISAMGAPDPNRYLAPLPQAQQPPPNPLQQAEIAMKQADAKVKEANAQAAVLNQQAQMQKQQQMHDLEIAKLNLEQMKITSELQLKQMEFQHKVAVDAAEIKLQEQAQANDKLQAEAMPTR